MKTFIIAFVSLIAGKGAGSTTVHLCAGDPASAWADHSASNLLESIHVMLAGKYRMCPHMASVQTN